MAFELPALPYSHDALEPAIDAQTMQIHHGKHHAAYVNNLNAALEGQADLQGLPLEDLLADNAGRVPESIRQAVINNGGGHANHSLFWSILAPKGQAAAAPTGALAEAIDKTFGGLDALKGKIAEAGAKRFGSGWAWLVVASPAGQVRTAGGGLEVFSTANQDSPLMQGKTPILGIDVWEHAYYLQYQNRRPDYLKEIWSVVNWAEVGSRYGS